MEILHILIDWLVLYIKLVKATMPVVQLAVITFASLGTGMLVLSAITARRKRACCETC